MDDCCVYCGEIITNFIEIKFELVRKFQNLLIKNKRLNFAIFLQKSTAYNKLS